MATTAGVRVVEPESEGGVPWPSAASPDLRVPIAFLGQVIGRSSLPDGMGLDQIAPTIAQEIGFARSHPEVRAGTAVTLNDQGAAAAGTRVIPLVVEIGWRGVGTDDLGTAWPPRTAALIKGGGAGTLGGNAGSLPLDPAATLTTIGTGGSPFQHGVTGSMIRDDHGGVEAAWTDGAPTSVISTLADDLHHAFGSRSRVGIVAPERTDRGLVGTGWYLGAHAGELILRAGDPAPVVTRLLHSRYGAPDGAPDVLGVVVRGSISTIDRETDAIVSTALARVPNALIVVAGTGSLGSGGPGSEPSVAASEVAQRVVHPIDAPVVTGSVAGGIFLSAKALDTANLSADVVVREMRNVVEPDGQPLFSAVFPAFSVAFARYC
jgi:hypothetical protein